MWWKTSSTTMWWCLVYVPSLWGWRAWLSLLHSSDHLSLLLPPSQVDEEELRKQREEITAIVKMRVAGTASGTQVKDRTWGGGPRPSTCTHTPGIQPCLLTARR